MKTRYTADALISWGREDAHKDGLDHNALKYKTFTGEDLDLVVQSAERASLDNEAHSITEQKHRPQYDDWETIDYINYY